MHRAAGHPSQTPCSAQGGALQVRSDSVTAGLLLRALLLCGKAWCTPPSEGMSELSPPFGVRGLCLSRLQLRGVRMVAARFVWGASLPQPYARSAARMRAG